MTVVVIVDKPFRHQQVSVWPDTVRIVKQVVKVRMLPTREQAAALQATLLRCNQAASWLSAAMHAVQMHRKHETQKRFYTDLKQQFGLSAQSASG
ncbi:hypothetical protein [Mycobacterium sp.]|uniref:hypothetical protein n=1 Tax=Mycobacterium sp. TaxID=1785 RepID=UPI003C78645E